MSFSFGFTEDIDEETVSIPSSEPQPNSLDTAKGYAPLIHDMDALLKSLLNTRITFETVITAAGNHVYRRALFDVKHQVMSEDTAFSNKEENGATTDADTILLNNAESDLEKNVYEGGFKSWECSLDLLDFLSSHELPQGDLLELGCGSALPSCFLLQHLMKASHEAKKIVLSDYNASVLRLVTLPNLIINWAKATLSTEQWVHLQLSDGEVPIMKDELQLSSAILEQFNQDLKRSGVELHLISGAWGRAFLELVDEISVKGLVYSSETIYSLDTLPVLSELLTTFFSRGNQVLVSAKDIYFGVGGSVVEFARELKSRNVGTKVQRVEGHGLGRSIVSLV